MCVRDIPFIVLGCCTVSVCGENSQQQSKQLSVFYVVFIFSIHSSLAFNSHHVFPYLCMYMYVCMW